ncbi:hypothetical protein FIV42_14960 [Persicimonas caeni]|uniref:Peptidase C-terminal archaeal/bacterial domain-containing protein n=1 Tax=Persicimonas caeni TaxID=2292766 RepID=A0A4Y6PUI4_PERCE|nr:hypothetical protein [Persicimonas caeni]QDG51991.1 hypothetical protein FIV42_14960 [Persicimonas caeni]QED33212.1 hypothetical protein FRD00_14955 [Persicimonas caeni]
MSSTLLSPTLRARSIAWIFVSLTLFLAACSDEPTPAEPDVSETPDAGADVEPDTTPDTAPDTAPDLCAGLECPEGTLCNPQTGLCEVQNTCTTSADCAQGESCLDARCVPSEDVCEVLGCTGNQHCLYDEASASGRCEEDDVNGCTNALDCVGERVCVAGACAEPQACRDDMHEANDLVSQATEFQAAQSGGVVQGTVCAGDSDHFKYNLAWQTTSAGMLTARLQFAPEDVGVGDVTLELVEPSGAVRQTATSDASGLVEVEQRVLITNQGEWIVRVKDAGNTETAGVRYALSVDLVPEDVDTACEQATELSAPQSIHGTTDLSQSFEMGSSCTASDNRSGEVVYSFELSEQSWVTATVTPDDDETMSLAVRTACGFASTEIACENQQDGVVEYGQVLEPGTYYVIVQGREVSSGGGFTLDLDAEPVVCSFRDNGCADADTARVCDASRTGFDQVTCPSGCDSNTGYCQADAESCMTAIDASQGGTFTGEIHNLLRHHRLSDTNPCLGHRVDGSDAVYRVDANGGDMIRATVDAPFDAALWIAASCPDASDSCVAGTDMDNPEKLDFEVPTDGTYYVVVSAVARGAVGTYTLDIEAGAPQCIPGEKRCLDADTIEYCGCAASWEYYDCAASCASGECATSTGDICPEAIPAADGDTHTFDPTSAQDDIRAVEHCLGDGAPAPDGFYAVELDAKEVLEVTVSAQNGRDDTAIYLLEDCMNPEQTCLKGADREGDGGDETLRYRAPVATTVYVVVDGDSAAKATGLWGVSFTIHSPLCTPYDARCAGPDTLEYCDAYGIEWVEQSCYGFGCSANACIPPSNDTCATAADAGTTGASFQHNIEPYRMDYQLPVGEFSCTGFTSFGPDAVYKVHAQAGQVITAEVNSVFDAQLWITTDCSTPAWEHCVVGDDEYAGWAGLPPSTEKVQHKVETTGTYYIIVTAEQITQTDQFPNGDFTVDISVDTPICTPGATTCLDAQTMEYCGNFGLQEIRYVCDGGCQNGVCADPRGQVCADAIPADDGDFFVIDMTQHGDISDLHKNQCGGTTNSVNGMASDGPEAYFEVDLQAGEVLTVQATPHHDYDDPMIYVVTDCTDTPHTCEGGVNNALKGEREVYHYQSSTDQTVYVVVDSALRTHGRDDYEVSFDIAPQVCQPGQALCQDKMSRTCNEAGTAWIDEWCTFGCTAGACDPASNDRCVDAFRIPGSGLYDVDMWDVTNTESRTCLPKPGDAEEAFFKFELAANEVLDVEVIPWAEADEVLLSLVSDCNDPSNTCLAAADNLDSGMAERIIYQAGNAPETVYLIVESVIQWSAPGTGETRGIRLLDVKMGPRVCNPLETVCASQTVMSYCNESGTTWETWACDGICASGECVDATGETCIDAIDASGGGVFTGRIETFGIDHPLGDWRTNCTGSSDVGPDVVYEVEAYAGDVIRAELDADFWGSIRIVDDCTDAVNNCVIGESNGNPREVTYRVPSNGTYYVIVSSFMEASRGEFEVRIDAGPQICTAGDAHCTGSTLETCSPSGTSWLQKDCLHGCTTDACDSAPNDTCAGVIDATGGGSYTVDPALLTDTVDLGSTGCLGEATPAPDAFYRVDLAAGDILEATLTPQYWGDDPAIYLVSDCATAQTTCLDGVDEGQPGDAEELVYQAAQAETVYLVVDGDSVDEANKLWDLDIAVGPLICNPEETRCADATTLEYCGVHGTRWHSYTCDGSCSAGACATPTGDVCIDAIPVGGGGTFAADMTSYTNTLTPQAGACYSSMSLGNEVVYAITLAAGQTADIRVIPDRDDTAEFYLLSSCLRDDYANTCLAEATPPDPFTKTLEYSYTAVSDETVYLVVDAASQGAQSGVWQVDVGIW